MATTKAQQFNINIPEATEFTRCPLAFFGKHKEGEENQFSRPNGKARARADLKVLSLIYTETTDYGADTKITKAHIARKCGLSKAAVTQAIRRLKAARLIKELKTNVYKIIPNVSGRRYIVFENYLHKAKIDFAGKIKKLTQTAVAVLERIISFYKEFTFDPETGEKIYTHYDFKNRKVKVYFQGSEASIAKYMNLPTSTVSYAILELIRAKLLRRNKRLRYKDENDNVVYKTVNVKGVTGNTLSLFTVPYELLVVEQKSTYKAKEIEFIDEIADLEGSERIEISDAEIDREYLRMRTTAQANAEVTRKKANADKEYRALRAELMGATCTADIDRVAPRYYARLDFLGINEEDFNPRYNCPLCEDKGQNLNTGQRCRCRAKVKRTIISRKLKA